MNGMDLRGKTTIRSNIRVSENASFIPIVSGNLETASGFKYNASLTAWSFQNIHLQGALRAGGGNITIITDCGGVRGRPFGAASFGSATHTVNVNCKEKGVMHYDQTNDCIVVAQGDAPTDPWIGIKLATPFTVITHTPS